MLNREIVGTVVTQGGNLNLREAPSTSANVIGSVPNGRSVHILEDEQNGFFKVEFNGTEGYVSASFIMLPSYNRGIVATNGGNLNLREAPSTNARIIASMPNGSSLTILGEENGFYRVVFGTQEGFASENFVRMAAAATGRVTTAGGNLNMRSAPSPTAPIIGTIPNTTSVIITGEQNGFYRVAFSNRTGYASKQFILV